jgi:hypothetical protein
VRREDLWRPSGTATVRTVLMSLFGCHNIIIVSEARSKNLNTIIGDHMIRDQDEILRATVNHVLHKNH